MSDFMPGMATGVAAALTVFGIAGATYIVPGWTDRVTTAKTQACEAAGAKLQDLQEKAKGGQCVKGNTIVLRFKD